MATILKLYDSLPWAFRAGVPILLTVGTTTFCHHLFHFNFLEFLGCTYSIGLGFLLLYHFFLFIYRNWVGVALGHNTDLKKLGSWAVVTGCTAGIGEAYSHALAKRGLNLVLMSRSKEKLEKIEREIRELYQVQTKVIPVDFTEGMEIYNGIEEELKDLEIGTLINNVGMSYPFPEYFIDLPHGRKFYRDMLNCNMMSLTMMTAIVLPGMLQRKKGAVVNVGSLTSILDTPFMALYGASKAFVDKFTQDLALEHEEHGIIFQSLIPGYIVSNMSKVKKSNFFVPTPEAFVEKAIQAVGLQSRTAVWLPHQILHACIHIGQFFRRDGAAEVR
ncbi:Very-long-chain 3-oxoacyl-CoA reductase [Orchesella cincta]|uniref:Very-long-chain 3-oxoacyl-CoA reductase n=1 Tax=Orchesella cincta TaxID=48709 RepID=A0A1D2NHW8_ORCCI|nr:Very-long-chain 3-oxoacyl-CoA reductase [Orchesella cincta]